MTRKRIGTLKDCICRSGDGGEGIAGVGDVTIKVDTPPMSAGGTSFSSGAPVKKPRKPRSKGKGPFCVISHKGKTVHCYEDSGTANRVADSFTKRGRAGTKFTVQKRG